MALDNTTDRYRYIYGSNVRKLDTEYTEYGQTVRKNASATPAKKKNAPKKSLSRTQRELARSLVFDWRYTVTVIASVLLCVCGSMFYVAETAHINNLSSRINELKTEKTLLESKKIALESEISKSLNLDEIRIYAEEKLGMTEPDSKHTIKYDNGSDDYFYQYDSVTANE